MICDAPTQPLQPPSWQLTEQGSADLVVALGFSTVGTEAQLTKLANVVQSSGFVCGTEGGDGKPMQLLVFFGPSTTRTQAFDIYNRVDKGEFGTGQTSLILVPAKEAAAR